MNQNSCCANCDHMVKHENNNYCMANSECKKLLGTIDGFYDICESWMPRRKCYRQCMNCPYEDDLK